MPPVYDPASLLGPLLGNWTLFQFLGLAAIAFYCFYSLILLYHWMRYGLNPFTAFFMMVLYFGVSLPLLAIIWSSAHSVI
ncbi:MAG TPA: hypothetical protein VJI74_03380 [Candidatus Paceibacterota bacterium]